MRSAIIRIHAFTCKYCLKDIVTFNIDRHVFLNSGTIDLDTVQNITQKKNVSTKYEYSNCQKHSLN